MNDPHVAALHYRIKHAPDVDFEEAPPVEHSGPGCSVHIENGKAKIVMKCHHSTEKAARDAVEPFLRAWELSWALRHPSDQFEFAFLNGELVDRKPFPPQSDHFVQAELPGVSSAQAGTHIYVSSI
jgi:hypothetical protein